MCFPENVPPIFRRQQNIRRRSVLRRRSVTTVVFPALPPEYDIACLGPLSSDYFLPVPAQSAGPPRSISRP